MLPQLPWHPKHPQEAASSAAFRRYQQVFLSVEMWQRQKQVPALLHSLEAKACLPLLPSVLLLNRLLLKLLRKNRLRLPRQRLQQWRPLLLNLLLLKLPVQVRLYRWLLPQRSPRQKLLHQWPLHRYQVPLHRVLLH